jgi:alcohol dehydrogenase class IV
MHEGALTVNASKNLKNFKHIIFNNEAHDSVGSQPTANNCANISQIALNSGYEKVYSAQTQVELETILPEFINNACTSLLEIKVKCGAREDLGRPKEKPCENKKIFMENLNQIDFVYQGAIENLSKILKQENVKQVLIFTGKKSYSNIKPIIETQLKNINFKYYNNFSTNPKEKDIKTAVNENNSADYDIIIAIGGGSVMDFAKAFKWYKKENKKLIAIPTTAGTGAEATQFAVLYVNGIKKSLDNPSILPNYAIVDSQFVEHNSYKIKVSCGLDAFCQAIESYWAVNSIPISRQFAKEAMILCRDYFVEYVNNPNPENSEKIMIASNLSGKAINISRTTAAHALSYKLTSDYNIPHGIAVGMNISSIIKLNLKIDNTNCNDYRGVNFVQERMKEIFEYLNIQDVDKYFNDLFKKINFEQFIPKNIDMNNVIESVNSSRLGNNPRLLEIQALKSELCTTMLSSV